MDQPARPGPLFDIRRKIEVIGDKMNDADKNEVVIPIPHAYFKSVLAENLKGRLTLWSFIMENKKLTKPTPTTSPRRLTSKGAQCYFDPNRRCRCRSESQSWSGGCSRPHP